MRKWSNIATRSLIRFRLMLTKSIGNHRQPSLRRLKLDRWGTCWALLKSYPHRHCNYKYVGIIVCGPTQRAKKQMKSNCEEKIASKLTPKRRRDPFRKRRRPAFVICRGQTRSLKGYSFLNGVMAPRRPPPMDGSSGPETKVHRGTATSCVSTALYGL